MKEIFNIARLMAGKIGNKNIKSENEIIDKLMQDSQKYKKIYDKCRSENFNKEQSQLYMSFDSEQAYKRLKRSKLKLSFTRIAIPTVAASIILGLLLILNTYTYKSVFPDKLISKASSNIVLILSSGEFIHLDNKFRDTTIVDNGLSVRIDSKSVEYIRLSDRIGGSTFNEIMIPSGYTYSAKLSDGTNIILNGGSNLKIPSDFGLKNREVFIDGQAYMSVAKDKKMPFRVNSNSLRVEVTGTKFDIRDYKSFPMSEINIIEGSVNVKTEKNKMSLVSNDRIVFNSFNNQIIQSKVDTQSLSSWINGVLTIRSDSFNLMIEKLKKWYGVDFKIYADVDDKILFTGDFKKDDLENALKNIAINTNLKLEYYNKTIIIRNK